MPGTVFSSNHIVNGLLGLEVLLEFSDVSLKAFSHFWIIDYLSQITLEKMTEKPVSPNSPVKICMNLNKIVCRLLKLAGLTYLPW